MQKQSAVARSRPVDPPAATESDSAVVVAVEGPELKQAVQTGSKIEHCWKKDKHPLQVHQRDRNEYVCFLQLQGP